MADEPDHEAVAPAEADAAADADSPTAEVVADAPAEEAAAAEAPAKPKRARKPKTEEPVAEEAPAAAPAEEPAAEPVAEAEPAEAPVVDAEPETAEAVAEPEPAAEVPKPKRAPAKKAAPKKPAAKKKPAPKTERGTYVRTPATEGKQGQRKERRGLVVSSSGDKTITVRVDVMMAHPKYKKIMRRSMKLRVHDEANTANVGDTVRVVECRPLSKTKRWRLVEIVEVAR